MKLFESFNPPKISHHPRFLNVGKRPGGKRNNRPKDIRATHLCKNCGYPLGLHIVLNCPTPDYVDISISKGLTEKTRLPLNPYPFTK
jgi:hypothetical protein